MFDLDADIGVRDCGLSYMVNQARPHAGFPEAALKQVRTRNKKMK